MINPMSKDDREAILYLDERSKENTSLYYAWTILKTYYNRCLEELKNKNTLFEPFQNTKEKDKILNFVKEKIKDKEFFKEVSEFLEVSEEEVDTILNKKKLSVFDEWIVAQINRYYNMKLKLGHSARITYIAEYNLNKTLKDNKYFNRELLENTVILSALLHDIGRFYQAINYNTLIDKEMKEREKEIGNNKVDHAIAGYYYSLSTAMEFHKLVNESDAKRIEDFISQTIAATVIKYHQQPNSSISYFDYNGDTNILNNENMKRDLLTFINNSYENAKSMNCRVEDELDPKQKRFIDEFIKKIKEIIRTKTINFEMASGFPVDMDFVECIQKDIETNITNTIKNSSDKTLDEITDEIMEIVNREIEIVSNEKIEKYEQDGLRNYINKSLEQILNYDISEAIKNSFENNNQINDTVRYMISSALSSTMDADKIDILNQRALGIYNAKYELSSFKIFPEDNKSLIELLNQYFKFNLNKESINISEREINVINNSSKELKQKLKSYLSEFDIFEYNEKNREYNIKENINIIVRDDLVIIKENETIRGYNSDKFKKMFTGNYLDFLCERFNINKDEFKKLKEGYTKEFQIEISRNDLDKNIEENSLSKIDTYKKLIVTDGLIERFMLEEKNPILSGWINKIENDDSNHLVYSTVAGLLWQINQFIFVNMRNRHSYEFIEDNHILDDILEQYKIKAKEISIIIEPYIEYAKEFVHYMVNNMEKDMLNSNDLKEAREKVYEQIKNKNLMQRKTIL